MTNTKLKVTIGGNKFQAEGPKEVVDQQFREWKELVVAVDHDVLPAAAPDPKAGSRGEQNKGQSTRGGEKAPDHLDKLYIFDEKRDALALRSLPQTDDRDGDALLLLIYGYRILRELDEVPVTKLTESMKMSGLGALRIDRAASGPVEANLLVKGGRGKGGKYRLSTTGWSCPRQWCRSAGHGPSSRART